MQSQMQSQMCEGKLEDDVEFITVMLTFLFGHGRDTAAAAGETQCIANHLVAVLGGEIAIEKIRLVSDSLQAVLARYESHWRSEYDVDRRVLFSMLHSRLRGWWWQLQAVIGLRDGEVQFNPERELTYAE